MTEIISRVFFFILVVCIFTAAQQKCVTKIKHVHGYVSQDTYLQLTSSRVQTDNIGEKYL